QGEDVFRKRRSLFFKKMQIVRGCDTKRNVLVYMVYSDRRFAEEFDLVGADHALGRGRPDPEVRGLRRKVARSAKRAAPAGVARGTRRGSPSSWRAAPTTRAACRSPPRRSC